MERPEELLKLFKEAVGEFKFERIQIDIEEIKNDILIINDRLRGIQGNIEALKESSDII